MNGMMTDKQMNELVSEVNKQRRKQAIQQQSVRHNVEVPIPLTVGDVAIVLGTYARMRYVLVDPLEKGDEHDER